MSGPVVELLEVGLSYHDAPVLAGADVSIAMAEGAALAQRAADFVVTSPSLLRIPEAIALARRTQVIVRQNLAWALGYNLLALPLADTLKAAAAGRVDETLSRADKWLAQTPQMFRLGTLQRALARAAAEGMPVTDEASAVEALGLRPLLVPGMAENFKLTWPADFELAARLLETRA